MWTEIPDIIPVDTDAAKKRVNKILQIPLPTGVVVVAALMLFTITVAILNGRKGRGKREKRLRLKSWERMEKRP